MKVVLKVVFLQSSIQEVHKSAGVSDRPEYAKKLQANAVKQDM